MPIRTRQPNVNAAQWSANGSALGAVDLTQAGAHVFGLNVFSEAVQRQRLPKDIFKRLQHALDTGEPTRGGARVARASTELIFAFLESQRRGGTRVELPLRESSLRLEREFAPRQPKFTA